MGFSKNFSGRENMLANKNKSINYNAVSKIDDTVVMYMTGNYNSETGDINFNQSIRNKALYLANKDTIEGDVEEWKNEILKEIE